MPVTNATTDTQIVPILEPGEYAQFMLRTPVEIMPVMHGLRDQGTHISVFFNEGQDTLLSVLVAVANDHLILDISADDEINRKAVAAGKHFCVTTLDKVRVQFILRGFTLVSYEGRPAFRAMLPDEVLRLQRREYYRLIAPIARPLEMPDVASLARWWCASARGECLLATSAGRRPGTCRTRRAPAFCPGNDVPELPNRSARGSASSPVR